MFSFSDDSVLRDQITPYRCCLLILIKEYADFNDGKNKPFQRRLWQDDLTSKRHLDRALLSWIQQPDGSLKEMLRTLSLCSKVLYSGFCTMLDTICDYESVANLDNFFSNLWYTIFDEKKTLLSKQGLLGLFCRRMLVYYDRLTFCEVQPFFKKFMKYCSSNIALKQPNEAKKRATCNISDETATNNSMKEHVDDMELESQSEMDSKSSHGSIDADLKPSELKPEKCEDLEAGEYLAFQQEFFFAQQAALIEAKESDALPPAALQNKIRQILKSNPELTEAHYVSYLNNLRLREFCGAIDSLFMYFIRHNRKLSPAMLKKLNDKDVNRTQRFATLNLALLHLRCGHKKAALAATKESISLSQLAKDPVCLQHAMSLLNHLDPKMSSHKVANEIVKPGKSHNLTDLAFLAVQAHMKQVSVNSRKPSLVFRNLAAADALQCTRPYTHYGSTTFAHKASLWRMYGKRQMALLHCQLALSMQSAVERKLATSPTRYNSEDIALSLSHLIELLSEEGMVNSSNDVLCHAKQRFPTNSRHSHFWRKTKARLHHQANLRLCKYLDARQAQSTLMLHDAIEANLRKAENLASRNEISQSHTVLLKILRDNETRNQGEEELAPEIKCQIFILLGSLLSRNNCEQANSFRYLLDALSIARKHYLHHLHNEALLKLAQLQLHCGSPSACLSCLKSMLFESFANSDLHMRSRVILVLVRCLLKINSSCSMKDIDGFIDSLLQSKDGFDKSQDLARQRDVVYLLAKIFDERSRRIDKVSSRKYVESVRRRSEFASEFKRLDIQIGSLKFIMLV